MSFGMGLNIVKAATEPEGRRDWQNTVRMHLTVLEK